MNKKMIMMAVLCAVGTAATAQLEKGKLMIGGNVGLHSYVTENGIYGATRTNGFSISPRASYFIKENLVIGTSISYGFNKRKGIDYDQEQSVYALNPFARYYLNITDHFKFFGEFMLSAGGGNTLTYQHWGIVNKSQNKYYSASIAPGLAFLPAKKWSIDLRFGLLDYTNQQVKDDSPDAENKDYVGSSQFNFGLNTIRPSIGINFHL